MRPILGPIPGHFWTNSGAQMGAQVGPKRGPQWDPKWPPAGAAGSPKTFTCKAFQPPGRPGGGPKRGPKMGPKWAQKWAQNGAKRGAGNGPISAPPNGCKMGPFQIPTEFSTFFGSDLGQPCPAQAGPRLKTFSVFKCRHISVSSRPARGPPAENQNVTTLKVGGVF